MKINTISSIVVVLCITSCLSNKQVKETLVCIDVTKTYPDKEVLLTDIAEVTYLYLSSDDDDYLYSGGICCLTKHTVVVFSNTSGDILFFTKDGNPKSRFNKRGNGPEEYIGSPFIIYDEKADDVFVARWNVIQVYSSTGEYKRKISLPQETVVGAIVSMDDHSLFLTDANMFVPGKERSVSNDADFPTNCYESPFIRISKANGKVLDNVELPTNQIILRDGPNGPIGRTSRLIQCKEGVFLCNPETDSIFLYTEDKSLISVIYQTPSVSSLDPMVYLNNCVDTGNYQFLEVFTVRWEEGAFPFPSKNYMRDKKTGEIFRPKIIMSDYKGKEINSKQFNLSYANENVQGIFELDLIELKNADKDNKLSGKLQELVATLNGNVDNNVFMIVDFK